LHVAHREHQAKAIDHGLLAVPEAAHPFAARALEEGHVARVVDYATGVGIFPVDPGRKAEQRRYGVVQNSVSVVGPCGFSPRWCQAFRVAMRPRAVRTRKPCWMR